jgi:uncharacterized protein (TIGR03000 family)
MKKFFGIAMLAALGMTLPTSEAQAFGRKKNNGCNGGGVVYASSYNSGCCGSTGYGYGAPVRYGSYSGSPVYYGSGYNTGYYSGVSYSTPVYYGSGYGTASYYHAPVSASYASPCCGTTYGTVGTYGSTSSYTPPVAMPNAGTTASTTSSTTNANAATITVMVPAADAQVWIDDNLTTQSGKERTLTTGTLTDGKPQEYVVKARWTDDNGKKVEKTKTVTAKAGQTSTADFR